MDYSVYNNVQYKKPRNEWHACYRTKVDQKNKEKTR